MRVLHINSYYLESLFYKNMYDYQLKNGMNINVYVPISNNKNKRNFNYGEYTIISKNHKKYDRIFFHLKHFKILNDIKLKYNINQFDLIHAHSLFSNGYIAYKLHQKYGIPYIVTVRNTDINVFFKWRFTLRRLGIKILLNADKIVFLSDIYRQNTLNEYIPKKYRKLLLKKIEIIPNGIDDFWLKNRNTKPKKIKNINNIRLVFAGRIDKNKNLISTINACKILIKKGMKIKFTIVGKVQNKIIYDEIRKEPFVCYIKELPKEELIDVYRNNDIYIMPSLTESFGLVYAEAITQGLPVIYSKDQGFDGQFLEGEVGYHVISTDVNDICDKILLIIRNYNKISNNCISLYDKFDWKRIMKHYDKIYNIGDSSAK